MKHSLLFFFLVSVSMLLQANSQQALSLQEAENMALTYDLSIKRFLTQAQALGNAAVSESDLPDPQLKFAAQNIPVDSWGLNDDPMTQAKVSLAQRFSAGDSRKNTREIYLQQQEAMKQRSEMQRLKVLYNTRSQWLDAYLWHRRVAILDSDKQLFQQLKTLTTSLYEVGKRQQQDVLRSDLELDLLLQKQVQAQQRFIEHRQQLSALLGLQILPRRWPETMQALTAVSEQQLTPEALQQQLLKHPQTRMLQYELSAKRAQVQLADSKTAAVWGVEVSYGYRDYDNGMGHKPSDLVSAMVNVSVPLWGAQRNDKRKQSSRLQQQDVQYQYDDALRQLHAQVQAQSTRWQQLHQRRKFYASQLINKSDAHVQGSLKAYESGVGDLSALMRASIDRQKLKLDYLQLQVDEQKALAKLHMLLGHDVVALGHGDNKHV